MKRFLAVGLVVVALYSATYAHASSSPGFVINGPATATTMSNDSVVQIPISVRPINGFTGGIRLQCALGNTPPGAVDLPICNFSLIFPTVTISGTQPGHTWLFVATEGKALPAAVSISSTPGKSQYLALIVFPVALLWLGINPAGFSKKRNLLLCVLLAGGFLGMIGCGASDPRTTPGTYTFLMHGMDTATGTIAATGSVTVSVQ